MIEPALEYIFNLLFSFNDPLKKKLFNVFAKCCFFNIEIPLNMANSTDARILFIRPL